MPWWIVKAQSFILNPRTEVSRKLGCVQSVGEGCLLIFCIAETKYLAKVTQGRVCLGHNSPVRCGEVRKAGVGWPRSVYSHRNDGGYLASNLFLCEFETPAHGTALSTFRMSLSTPVKLTYQIPHRNAHRGSKSYQSDKRQKILETCVNGALPMY